MPAHYEETYLHTTTAEQKRSLEAFTRTQRSYLHEMETQNRKVLIASERAKSLGLSNCFNLHANFNVKIYKNGEGSAFASVSGYKISPTNEDGSNNQGRKTGVKLQQNGLSGHGKQCLRVVSDCYAKMVKNRKMVKANNWRSYCAFASLSFRRILPKDDKQAKDIFRAFLMRLYRYKGEEIHYAWVAERQRGKMLNGGKKSYRMEHGETAIHFHLLTPEYIDKTWLNKAWNECVAENYLKNDMIDRLQYQQWLNEYDTHEEYEVRRERFVTRQTSRKPESPGIGEFMLTPNVRPVYNAGRYMAKYLSKDGEDLGGHLWSVSKKSRELTVPLTTKKRTHTVYAAGEIVNVLQKAVKLGKNMVFGWKDYNDYPGFWTPNGWAILEAYHALIDKYDIHEGKGTFTPKKRATKGWKADKKVLQLAGNT